MEVNVADIPDSAFDPTRSNEHESSEGVVQSPWLPVRPDAGLPASALTPDGKLASGQRFYKARWTKCQLIKGTEQRILDQDDGCSVFTIKKQCWKVSETWWVGPPKTLISTTQDDKDQDQYKDGDPKVVTVVFCPDGVATPAPPPSGGDPPPVWVPPREEKWGTGQATTSVEQSPAADYLVVREVWEELVPPAQQKGCVVTAAYKRFWKVTKTKLRDGPTTETSEPYTPETIESRIFIVPGCTEKVSRTESAEPLFDDVMAAMSGREKWTSVSSVWVPTAHLLVQFQIGEAGLTKDRVTALVEQSLASIHKVAGSVAETLVSRAAVRDGSLMALSPRRAD